MKLEQGQIDQSISDMQLVASLPDRHLKAWSHFFLGFLYQTKGMCMKRAHGDSASSGQAAKLLSMSYDQYVTSFEMAAKQDAAPALWARTNAALIAMQFRDSGQAMKLLISTSNTQCEMWEGISYKLSGGLADGAFHFAAMLNKLSSIFLSLSDVENALPLVLRYCFVRMHPLYLLCCSCSISIFCSVPNALAT